MRPTVKYRACGCAKYRPLTEAAGVIAQLSVSEMPARSACSSANSFVLLAVIGAGGIAERRTDAAISLAHQVVGRQPLVGAVAPVLARARVQPFGERLGQPIGQRLHHDRVVVVVVALEARGQLVGAEAGRHGERAEVVARCRSPSAR